MQSRTPAGPKVTLHYFSAYFAAGILDFYLTLYCPTFTNTKTTIWYKLLTLGFIDLWFLRFHNHNIWPGKLLFIYIVAISLFLLFKVLSVLHWVAVGVTHSVYPILSLLKL